VGLDGLNGLAVGSRSAVVLLYLGPCTLKDIVAVDLVIQRVEPPCSTPLSRTVQPPLESASLIVTRVISPNGHSRTLPPVAASVKQGPFPPTGFCCPSPHQYYSPIRRSP